MTKLESKIRKLYSKKVGPNVMLVFNGKHGDRYFMVPDVSALLAISLKILEERFKEGWIEHGEDCVIEPLGLDEAAIVALPEGRIKEKAKQELSRYKWEVKRANKAAALYLDVKAAITNKDGAAAWAILEQCSNEGFEYQTLTWETIHPRA